MLKIGCCPEKCDIWSKQTAILDTCAQIHAAHNAIATGKAVQTCCGRLVVTGGLDMDCKMALHKDCLNY